jgi:replicative DNA helicase
MLELNDYNAEMAVIGGILIDKSKAKIIEVAELLTSEDFYNVDNQKIFKAIEVCFYNDQAIDVVTVSNKLAEIRELENIGGLPYLAETAQNTPSAANIMAYTHIVANLSKLRQIEAQALEMRSAVYAEDGTAEDKINNALSIASNIGQDDCSGSERDFEDIQKELIKLVEERIDQGGGLTGESMGFESLDKRFNGFNDTDLIIVAGRPAMGKTTFGLNLTTETAKNKQVAIFSMEMSAEQITEKLWASNGDCPLSCIKTGVFEDKALGVDYFTQFHNGAAKTKRLKYTIDDRGGLTPQQVRAKCLKLKRRHGDIGLVMIDYLQLMTVNKSNGQTDKVTQISGALKALAKELRCPVVCLSQLNRGVESRPDKRPLMSDLRDSGAIEQDADIIMFCYRDDYYQELDGNADYQPTNVAEIITAKFRGGEPGKDYLSTQLKYSKFADIKGGYVPQSPKKKEDKKPTTKTRF